MLRRLSQRKSRIARGVAALPVDIDGLAAIDLHLYGRLCERLPPPAGLRAIPGEITRREGQLLYTLASEVWDGQGTVLEMGTLFGASTQWLGLGMADNPARRGGLVAADAFLPYLPARMVEQLQPLLGAHPDWLAMSADFQHVGFRRAYEALHADGQRYSEFLTIRQCYVPGTPGESSAETNELARAASSIGLLFIDSVKTWYPVRSLALALIENLRPGALVVWQDYRWFNSFGIPFLNKHLGDAMQVLAIADSTQVYRYRGGLGRDAVERAMPEAVADVPAADLRSMFREMAWSSYVRNDAYGVLSATLQLAMALATQGRRQEAWALFELARGVPGMGDHEGLLDVAQGELEALGHDQLHDATT
jgi:predicted O-methyltransferase YrrM